jgi:RNA recognition motif-containing protein
MLPKTIDEEDLHNMFAPYGELREVHIIRGPEGSSKGCAFVKFVDRDAAMVAIEDMNDIIPPVITSNNVFAATSPPPALPSSLHSFPLLLLCL